MPSRSRHRHEYVDRGAERIVRFVPPLDEWSEALRDLYYRVDDQVPIVAIQQEEMIALLSNLLPQLWIISK
jgi:hypothetical protein